MGTEYRLSPTPKDWPQRWRKIEEWLPQPGYKGRVWCGREPKGETKEQSYRRCWEEWKKVEARLDALTGPTLYQLRPTVCARRSPRVA